MENILMALLPIFLLITLGYFFKKISFPSIDFWKYADKFTYYILFPSLLIYKLSTAKLSNIDGYTFVLSSFLTLILISFVLILFSKFLFKFEGKAFTSIYQGAIRFNTYVFLALTDELFGDKGFVLAALLMTFIIPIINIFCISIFSIYASSSKITITAFFKSIFKNPLIIACLIGGLLNFLEISLFSPFEKTLELLSSAALPLGLLSVGVGLHIAHIREVKIELFVSLFFKLIFFPCSIFFIAKFLGLQNEPLAVLVLFASMPTASSSYILARELGGDLKLMSAIVTLQTLVSIVSISVILMLFDVS